MGKMKSVRLSTFLRDSILSSVAGIDKGINLPALSLSRLEEKINGKN